ncbi:MAG: Crp/Fnr family transcriptional regulator [Eubacteriales bacterium]|nr:Crp/Fnr family transcriptional regulator [Eubacteriales bacterium]
MTPANCREAIKQLPIFLASSEVTREYLLNNTIIRTCKKKNYLFELRDPVDSVYLLLDGFVVLDRESDSHGIKSIFLLGKGDLLNEVILDSNTASVTCRALSDCTVLCIPKTVLLHLMEQDWQLNQYILHSMTKKIRKLYRLLESTTRTTTLRHQIASRIWKFANDHGEQTENFLVIPFDMRITLIADFVGSNRETVSRIIKEMNELHILSLKNGTCMIYDMDKLLEYKDHKLF